MYDYDDEFIELEKHSNWVMYFYFMILLLVFIIVFFVMFQFEVFYMYITIFSFFMSIVGILLTNNKNKVFKICLTITLIISILIIIYYYFFSNKVESMISLSRQYNINVNESEILSTSLYRRKFFFNKGSYRSATIKANDIEYYVYYNDLLNEWKVKSIMLEIKEYLLDKYPNKEFYNITFEKEENVQVCFMVDGGCLFWYNKKNAYYKVYSVYSKDDNKNFMVTYTYDNDKVIIKDNFG